LLLCASTERSALAVSPRNPPNQKRRKTDKESLRVREGNEPKPGLKNFQNVGDVPKHTAGL